MRNPFLKEHLLVQTVLASSIFMTPLVQADNCIVNTHREDPLSTSSCSNKITISKTGQMENLIDNKAAIYVDSKDGQLIIEPGNQNGSKAILDTGGLYSNSIWMMGENGVVMIGKGSGVTAVGTVQGTIYVNGIGEKIINEGIIEIEDGAYSRASIWMSEDSRNVTVKNLSTGKILGANGTIWFTGHGGHLTAGLGFVLENEGLIQGNNRSDVLTDGTVKLFNFKSVTNSGQMLAEKGTGISVGSHGGDKETIAIHNKADGIISGHIGVSLNTNSILGEAGGKPGIFNEGKILSESGDFGTITFANDNPPYPYSHNSAQLLGGLINGGYIANNAGGAAIDLSGASKGEFIQQGGEIKGHVLLAQADGYGKGNVFTLAGGTITGNVTAANLKTRIAYIHQLSGGNLIGTLRGSWWGDTFNQSGGNIQTYQGGAESGNTDTFNISGGSFGTLKATIDKTKPNTTAVNFNGTVTSGAIVGSEGNALNINLHPYAHVTANAAISGLSGALTVHQDASLEPNSNITTIGAGRINNEGLINVSASPVFDLSAGTGTFSNTAMLELGSNGILTLNGNATTDVFRNEAGSYLNVNIAGDQYGQIKVNSAAGEAVLLSSGSFIKPVVTGELTETAFNIITVTGGGTINDAGAQIISGPYPFTTRLLEGNTILQLFLDNTPTDCTVKTARVDLLKTSSCIDSRISVESTGQIQNKDKSSAVLLLDNAAGQIEIDADNTVYGAKAVLATHNLTGTPTVGIHITSESKEGDVTIGAGSGVTAESNIANSHGIVVEGAEATITNAGLIQLKSLDTNSNASGIYIAATGSATITNRGEISNNGNYTAPVITVAAGGQLLGTTGLTNSGSIINNTPRGVAIDLSQASYGVFNQKVGKVQGDVFLAQGDGNGGGRVFTLDGDSTTTITGNVTAANTQPYTYELYAGKVIGTFTGGTKGDTFYQHPGSQVSVFQGKAGKGSTDAFHIDGTGGSFGALKTSTTEGSATEVNFSGHYTLSGSILGSQGNKFSMSVGRMVTNANFIANGAISGLSGDLTVFKDSTFVPNSKVMTYGNGRIINQGIMKVNASSAVFDLSSGGTFSNMKSLELGEKGVLTIKAGASGNAFTNENEGSISININNETYGQIKVETMGGRGDAVVLNKGSTIQPVVVKGTPRDTTFDIITVTGGGTISDKGVQIVQPAKYIFTKQLSADNQTFQLLISSNSYRSLSSSALTAGSAAVLDVLSANEPTSNDFALLFEQMDQLPTQSAVDEAMQTLTLNHNGLIQGAKQGMNDVFNTVSGRSANVAHFSHGIKEQGSNYGDHSREGSVWSRVLGSYSDQSLREGIAGYNAKGAGLAFGTDVMIFDGDILGIAVNYYKSSVNGKSVTPRNESIKSWQGTLYGYFDFEYGIFLDAMVAASVNDYKLNRVIAANRFTTAAQASFGGIQWGAQADLGVSMLDNADYLFAPFVRAKGIHLSLDNYTETGAGDLGLSVKDRDVSELTGGIGVKLSTIWEYGTVAYVPELTALIGYDFVNDGESPTANFIGGGPAFITNGVTPSRTLFDLGFGLNVIAEKHAVFTLKYDLEARSSFWGNAGYIQYSYRWS